MLKKLLIGTLTSIVIFTTVFTVVYVSNLVRFEQIILSDICESDYGICSDTYDTYNIGLSRGLPNFIYTDDEEGFTLFITPDSPRGDCEDYSFTWLETIGRLGQFDVMYLQAVSTNLHSSHAAVTFKQNGKWRYVDNSTTIPISLDSHVINDYTRMYTLLRVEGGVITRIPVKEMFDNIRNILTGNYIFKG